MSISVVREGLGADQHRARRGEAHEIERVGPSASCRSARPHPPSLRCPLNAAGAPFRPLATNHCPLLTLTSSVSSCRTCHRRSRSCEKLKEDDVTEAVVSGKW